MPPLVHILHQSCISRIQTYEDPTNISISLRLFIFTVLGAILSTSTSLLIPLQSVNLGPHSNYNFIFASFPLSFAFAVSLWVTMFHFLLPQLQLKKFHFFSAIAVSAIFVTVLLFYLATMGDIFPVPYAAFLLGSSGIPPVFVMCYILYSKEQRMAFRENAKFAFQAIGCFIVAVLIGLGWTAQLYNFNSAEGGGGGLGSFLWMLLYEPLKFYSKMYVVAPCMVFVNNERWFVCSMVVDIFFTNFLVCLFAFTNDDRSALIMVIAHLFSCLWRVFSGWDRFDLWWEEIYESRCSWGCFGCSEKKMSTVAVAMNGLDKVEEEEGGSNDSDGGEEENQIDNVPTTRRNSGRFFRMSLTELHEEKLRNFKIKEFIELQKKLKVERENRELRQQQHSNPISTKISRTRRLSLSLAAASSSFTLNERPKFHDKIVYDEPAQRTIFNFIEVVAGECSEIIVRFQYLIASLVARNCANFRHLYLINEIEYEDWKQSMLTCLVVTTINLLILIKVISAFVSSDRMQSICSFNKLIHYIYNFENIWYLGICHATTMVFCWSVCLSHYGFDFSLNLAWVGCHEEVVFPNCVEMNLTTTSISTSTSTFGGGENRTM